MFKSTTYSLFLFKFCHIWWREINNSEINSLDNQGPITIFPIHQLWKHKTTHILYLHNEGSHTKNCQWSTGSCQLQWCAEIWSHQLDSTKSILDSSRAIAISLSQGVYTLCTMYLGLVYNNPYPCQSTSSCTDGLCVYAHKALILLSFSSHSKFNVVSSSTNKQYSFITGLRTSTETEMVHVHAQDQQVEHTAAITHIGERWHISGDNE